ncbi:winged helix DNA-binding protein [Candidatus Woesearchaeota archaeon]|nr:winged helix DNA-binding protein [Candidatus Woesearchaeota archaeon]
MRSSSKRKVILALSIVAGFLLITSITAAYLQSRLLSVHACVCFARSYFWIPAVAALGMIVGSVAYYLMAEPLASRNCEKALCLLPENEALIMKLVLEKPLTQAAIVKATNLSRLQTHRVLKKLLEKQLVEKVENKKTFVVKASKLAREIFRS